MKIKYAIKRIAIIGVFAVFGIFIGSKIHIYVSDKHGTRLVHIPAYVSGNGPIVTRLVDKRSAENNLTDAQSADTRLSDNKPADNKPADTRPADTRPADNKPADTRPADIKTRSEADEFGRNETKQEKIGKIAASCRSDPQHSNRTKSLYYCPIGKVATTFTNRLLWKIPYCRQSGKCMTRTGTSGEEFSFMWSRDPYTKLFSAYEDKLFRPNNYMRTIGIPIIKTVRRNATEKSLKIGHDVTFAELVKYVLKNAADGTTVDQHLRPIHVACNPCTHHFDYVGKLETFKEDINYVCSQFLDMGFITDMSQCDLERETNQMLGRVKVLYKTLSNFKNYLSVQDQFKMFRRIWKSYQIRGLLSKKIEMPFNVESESIKPFKMRKAFNNAISASTDKSQLKAQRQEALIQAYMTVPLEDMEKLKDFVEKDCQIFGYDLQPAFLFQPRNGYKPEYDYFDGLN